MASEFIDINLNDVDDGSDPLPDGIHLVRVKSCEQKQKEGSAYPYLDVRLNPLDIEGKENRVLFLTLSYNPKALWNMKRFCKAFHISFDKGIYLNDFAGKEGRVTVKIEPSRDDPETKVNTVSSPYHVA